MDNNNQQWGEDTKMKYKSPREIDILTRDVESWWEKTFVFIRKKEIKTWQAAFILAFFTGAMVAIILLVNYDVQTKSGAADTGTATLTWNAPTTNADGTPLEDLAGYKIYYGTSARTGTDPETCTLCGYSNSIDVHNVTTYTFDNLTEGETYYFSVTAYDNASPANESAFSGEVHKAIPVTSDGTAPTVTAFTIPSTANSLTVSITTFTATDATGVTGYMVTESSSAPAAGAAGWTGSVPANYTFATAGSKTLYAWAKDAAGNVSTSRSDSVTITLADSTAPTVTAFAIPSTANSLTVSITTFTATDATGVTGYMVTESSSAPAAGAAGWTGSFPANYTFATAGSKTLYAWAKDAAGNVSTSSSDSVTITLPPDTAAPVVTFVIPANSSSLIVPITTFTATDATGVTGYMVTENSSAPAAGANGWSDTAPTNHTFTSQGSKTLYGWAKDAAGNVSAYVSGTSSDAVTITLPSDSSAPAISGILPSNNLSAGTTQTTIEVTTDEVATCKISSSAGISYASMDEPLITNGGTTHSYTLSGLKNGTTYNYYVRCEDGDGNASSVDQVITFSVASSSSSSSKKDSGSSSNKKKSTSPRTISNSPTKVSRGAVLTQRGKKFSKKSPVLLYFSKPGGGYYAPIKIMTTKTGSFSLSYRVTKAPGKYSWYALDTKTGKKSKIKTYTVK